MTIDSARLARIKAAAPTIATATNDNHVPEVAAGGEHAPKPWKRSRELVRLILQRAAEPTIPLTLGGETIAEVRLGSLTTIVGPSGAGKTSFVASLLFEHADQRGPVIPVSLELTGDEFTGRGIGARVDESWWNVLRGSVPEDEMLRVLPERVFALERREGTLANIRATIAAAREEYPDQPILLAVDYVQIMDDPNERDARSKVSNAMRDLDDIARELRVAIIVLSQGSRASSQALRKGEKLGADTTDAGAESAAIERYSSLTLAIGSVGPEAEDGTAICDLSIGKSRMGKGDVVIPMRVNGRTGRWRVAGEARPASEVRDERAAAKNTRKSENTKIIAIARANAAPEPLTKEDLAKLIGGQAVDARAGIAAALAEGSIVEVRRKKPRAKVWLVWTPERAREAGIPIVEESPE